MESKEKEEEDARNGFSSFLQLAWRKEEEEEEEEEEVKKEEEEEEE